MIKLDSTKRLEFISLVNSGDIIDVRSNRNSLRQYGLTAPIKHIENAIKHGGVWDEIGSCGDSESTVWGKTVEMLSYD